MGLFGNKQTVYLKYQINLTDPVQVQTLQGGPKGSPTEKIEARPPNFPPGTPANVPGTPNPAGKGADSLYGLAIENQQTSPFTYPCITSEWFTLNGTNNFPWNQTGFTRKSGGWFGFPALFGDTTTYYWRGEFNLVPANTGPGGVIAPNFARVRAITGFEAAPFGDGNSGNGSSYCRAASRSIQGYGWRVDSDTNNVVQTFNDKGGAAVASVWNRFYLRPRRFPLAATTIYKETGNTASSAGPRLDILPSGQLAMNTLDTGGTVSLKGTTAAPLVVHKWHKIDIITDWGAGTVNLYVNGALVLGPISDISLNSGVHLSQLALSAVLGTTLANSADLHFDDWVTADAPDGTLKSLDWVNGTRVVAIRPAGLAASNDGNWTGDWRSLCAKSTLATGNQAQMSSIVAGAVLAVTTDADTAADQEPGSIGYVALQVSMNSGSTIAGTFGYKLPGGSDVLIAETGGTVGAPNWSLITNLYRPVGTPAPIATGLKGLELKHVKGTGVAQSSTNTLMASAVLIGNFGPEDSAPGTTDTTVSTRPPAGLHNSAYPRSPWAKQGLAPISPVGIVSGTYVGTGTFKELTFPFPPCFILIRNTANSGNFFWYPAAIHGKKSGNAGYFPTQIVDCLQDPTFTPSGVQDTQEQQYVVRIVGTDAETNQAAVTYNYTAFCDPGQRFTTSGCLFGTAGANDIVTNLDSGIFTPEYLMMRHEVSAGGGALDWLKGLGHAATNISQTTAAESASSVSMSNGTITAKAAFLSPSLSSGFTQISYLAWRRNDQSQDTGLAGVLWLTSYTGDGSASRAISFPTSGLRPVFAIVTPHNGTSFYRDASHTGTTSSQWPGAANASTAIVGGGIDQLSVGSALNTNGVVYDVFVLPGSATAGNGGFSVAGTFLPVAPGNPQSGTGTQYDPTPADPNGPNNDLQPTVPISDGTNPGDVSNFGTQCILGSTRIVNIALSHLGDAFRVADVSADASRQASAARLHYSEDVDRALRAWDWPFATRYADLVLVGGTSSVPVNLDWQYSYRVPADFLKARRIVDTTGVQRNWNRNPIKFRLGSDDLGQLIFTNETTAQLEYTHRPLCAATEGDALFRSALSWLHASSIAPELAKDAERAKFCFAMFQQIVNTAETIGAQESQQAPRGDADWIEDRNAGPASFDPWSRNS